MDFTGPEKLSELTECRVIESIKETINKRHIRSIHFHFLEEYVNLAITLYKSGAKDAIFVISDFLDNVKDTRALIQSLLATHTLSQSNNTIVGGDHALLKVHGLSAVHERHFCSFAELCAWRIARIV